jgi:hypothetical protein
VLRNSTHRGGFREGFSRHAGLLAGPIHRNVRGNSPETARFLRCIISRSQPAKQEKVAATKSATVRQKNPMDCLFKGIPHTDASQIDRSAMRAARGEHGFTRLSLRRCRSKWLAHFGSPARIQRLSADCRECFRGGWHLARRRSAPQSSNPALRGALCFFRAKPGACAASLIVYPYLHSTP